MFRTKSGYIFLSFLLFISISLQAVIPNGYYDKAVGLKDSELKTALYGIIRSHVQLEYYSLSTKFKTTDWNTIDPNYPGGYFWDMYSNYKRTSWTGMNREHSLPKSWFGITSGNENSEPIGSDLHNLYPSDATANSAKSNYPLGEVTGTPSYTNSVVKVGTNGFSGYNGTVFEPADQYKGDFARDYMYMVTCYENYSTRWTSYGTSSMLIKNTYPVLNDYAVNLLLKWHRNDPVSEKEITRNDAVYAFQQNRNPFIDHPELAEFIWGKYKGVTWMNDGELPVTDETLSYYPVPATTSITVSLNKPENDTYTVYNLSGIVLKSGKFGTNGTMSVTDLSNGVYILMVYTKTTRMTGKFVVCHGAE